MKEAHNLLQSKELFVHYKRIPLPSSVTTDGQLVITECLYIVESEFFVCRITQAVRSLYALSRHFYPCFTEHFYDFLCELIIGIVVIRDVLNYQIVFFCLPLQKCDFTAKGPQSGLKLFFFGFKQDAFHFDSVIFGFHGIQVAFWYNHKNTNFH